MIPYKLSLTEKPRLLTFIAYILVDQLPFWILYSTRLEYCLIHFKCIYINVNIKIVFLTMSDIILFNYIVHSS